jgi:hypothetical protein
LEGEKVGVKVFLGAITVSVERTVELGTGISVSV